MSGSRWTATAWIGATWGGWLLGFGFIIAFALISDVIGLSGTQSFVGLGMGAGVGLVQARLVRRRLLPAFAPWFWSCVIGITAPFLIIDILRIVGVGLPYSLQAAVAAGGLLTGVLQARILEKRFHGAGSWIVASAAGWILAAGTSAISDWMFQTKRISGIVGALLYLGAMLAGGPLLGLVTSVALARMLQREPAV